MIWFSEKCSLVSFPENLETSCSFSWSTITGKREGRGSSYQCQGTGLKVLLPGGAGPKFLVQRPMGHTAVGTIKLPPERCILPFLYSCFWDLPRTNQPGTGISGSVRDPIRPPHAHCSRRSAGCYFYSLKYHSHSEQIFLACLLKDLTIEQKHARSQSK